MVRADVQLASKTQAGHRHQVEGLANEDAVFVTHQHPVFDAVLMVADGMGGHPRPREASEIAVRTAREFLFDRGQLEKSGDIQRALAGALAAANRAVRSLNAGGGSRPPGTTLSIAVVAEGVLHVAHVGDGSVYLMRDGSARSVAGGEDRRAGNRPAQFLGQAPPLEPEQRQLALSEGDRLLLCTDGLTRYFSEAGAEALEAVLGRGGVEIQAIASQLTAHSRPDDYDDDTTVALAEVTRVREQAPRATAPGGIAPAEQRRRVPAKAAQGGADGVATGDPVEPMRVRSSSGPLGWVVPLLVGAALLAGGFYLGRSMASTPAVTPVVTAATVHEPATPEQLSRLGAGNLILLDTLGGRVFALPTRGGAPGPEPVELRALKVGPSGRLLEAGRFRLDPTSGELTAPGGETYPVELDRSGGTIRVLRGGRLAVNTRPQGAAVFVDGRRVGPSPQRLTLPAGRHRVRVEGKTWFREGEVEVLPGSSVAVTMGPQ
ncbi:MAG TPA: protein phosphatase 2C domain-containing protein [Armatimonadota bacterium]|nr:protein phosphatase 2C domain-containing protein [Armatimonadota bacterium]